MVYSIAVDGPVGAGKSSVADEVAKRLNILHLDTGAMYRAFAWQALEEHIPLDDENQLCALAERVVPQVRYEGGSQHTYMQNVDVTGKIRTPEISMAASKVSKVPGVRRAMVNAQRQMAADQSMLLDGRDIGTNVLPDATIKIYLDASPEIRAKRRHDELAAKGDSSTYEEVLADVMARDKQDMTRPVDPLRPAEDAQILDSSDLSFEQVVEDILRRVNLKLGKKPERAEKFAPLYRAARGLAVLLFKTLKPVEYHGVENAQLDAPYILLGNHNSLLDPMLSGCEIYRYQVRFLGKKELVKYKPLKWLFEKLSMIAVDRHNMDMAAMRQCLKTLKEGKVLGIFPEGTRHHEGIMQEIQSGIAMIALRGGVKLLPCYISGKPRYFRKTYVYYGRPIDLTDIRLGGINKEACEAVLDRVRETYAEMDRAHQRAMADKKRG